MVFNGFEMAKYGAKQWPKIEPKIILEGHEREGHTTTECNEKTYTKSLLKENIRNCIAEEEKKVKFLPFFFFRAA